MRLVLDAGALVALERADYRVVALIKRERMAGRAPCTHGGVIGQVWRGGAGRQAPLARWLAGVEVVPLDGDFGKRAGVLLGKSRTSDVVDAAVVLLANHDDRILTSDPKDLRWLASAAGRHVDLIEV